MEEPELADYTEPVASQRCAQREIDVVEVKAVEGLGVPADVGDHGAPRREKETIHGKHAAYCGSMRAVDVNLESPTRTWMSHLTEEMADPRMCPDRTHQLVGAGDANDVEALHGPLQHVPKVVVEVFKVMVREHYRVADAPCEPARVALAHAAGVGNDHHF